jgi:hypothetical protein
VRADFRRSRLKYRRSATRLEREAVTLPLDHAFGFELADIGPAAIEVHGMTIAGFLDRGRETGLATDGRSMETVSAIAGPIRSRMTHLRRERSAFAATRGPDLLYSA